MKENLIHYRTCVCNINYHMVWSVKYRRKILTPEVEKYLQELVQQIADDKGFTVHLFECGEGDHVRCFVSTKTVNNSHYQVSEGDHRQEIIRTFSGNHFMFLKRPLGSKIQIRRDLNRTIYRSLTCRWESGTRKTPINCGCLCQRI